MPYIYIYIKPKKRTSRISSVLGSARRILSRGLDANPKKHLEIDKDRSVGAVLQGQMGNSGKPAVITAR